MNVRREAFGVYRGLCGVLPFTGLMGSMIGGFTAFLLRQCFPQCVAICHHAPCFLDGYAVLVDNEEEALRAVNSIAPEHLELLVNNVEDLIPKITNAGAIFVGEYSPEPLGDYIAGPNHTLPTSGSATFSSPLSTDDFLKKTSYINFSYNGLKQYKDSIMRLGETEGLTAHKYAIKVRFEDEERILK